MSVLTKDARFTFPYSFHVSGCSVFGTCTGVNGAAPTDTIYFSIRWMKNPSS